jgi:hypothetical protein
VIKLDMVEAEAEEGMPREDVLLNERLYCIISSRELQLRCRVRMRSA